MSLRMATVICAALLLIQASRSARAQTVTQRMEESFARVETGLNDVEQRKVITGAFDMEGALHSHAQIAYETFNSVTNALRATPNAATLAHLREFENRVQDHKARAERITQRIATIHVQIRDGNVMIGDQPLKSLNQQHINEMKRWMKPEVIERYRKKDPRFGQNVDADGLPKERLAGTSHEGNEAHCPPTDLRQQRHRGLLLKLGDLLVPPAEAAVAYACYYVCANMTEVCLGCLYYYGPFAVYAWNQYQQQVARCGTCPWFNPTCGLCRHFALQAFLTVLA